jgi:hypothetical protein
MICLFVIFLAGPTLDIADGQYTARIREDHTTANVMPPIRVADGSGKINVNCKQIL